MWEEAVRVYAFLRRRVSFLGNRHLPLCCDALLVQTCYTDASCLLYQFKYHMGVIGTGAIIAAGIRASSVTTRALESRSNLLGNGAGGHQYEE